MKKNSLFNLFSALALVGMILTACSPAVTVTNPPLSTSVPVATQPPAPASTEAPTASPTEVQPVNLTLSFWGSDLDSQVYQQRVDLFTAKNPNIKVNLVYIPSDYSTKVQTMIAGGTSPDVIQLAEDIHSYSSKGQIIPLDEYVTKNQVDLKARYGASNGLITAYSYQGNLYALPDRGGALILFFNKDMFDKAGISYPTKDWTWKEFLDAAQKLTINEGGKVTQYGWAAGSWWPWWMSFIYMNGGAVLDSSGKPVVNSDSAIAALQFYNDLVFKYKVAPSPTDYANLGTTSPDPLFAQGKVAMETTGFWNIASLKDVTFNWDIAPVFMNKNRATAIFGSGFAISKDCKNPDAAFALINLLTSEEGQMPIVNALEDAPANLAVLNSNAFLKASWSTKPISMNALAESADAIFPLPLNPKWNEMMKIFDDNLGEVFAGRAEVKPTLDSIQSQLEALLAAQ
jgi:multiple sugar transport system substrate-binding protein